MSVVGPGRSADCVSQAHSCPTAAFFSTAYPTRPCTASTQPNLWSQRRKAPTANHQPPTHRVSVQHVVLLLNHPQRPAGVAVAHARATRHQQTTALQRSSQRARAAAAAAAAAAGGRRGGAGPAAAPTATASAAGRAPTAATAAGTSKGHLVIQGEGPLLDDGYREAAGVLREEAGRACQ